MSDVTTDDPFGGCPVCGGNDAYLNLGREQWCYCEAHRTRWIIGSNLFSSWRDETPETWERNAEFFADFGIVESINPPRGVAVEAVPAGVNDDIDAFFVF